MRILFALLLLGMLAGCGQSEPEATPQSYAGDDAAQASANAADVEAKRTENYELRITQPDIDASYLPLLRAISIYSGQTRDEFLGQVEAAKAEGYQFETPWSLELDMRTVINTEALAAVEASGYQFQGGAHGMPLQATFVYLVESKRIMTLADWFSDEAVWSSISERSIAALKAELAPLMGEDDDTSEEALDAQAAQWLADGASADPHNFQLYLPQLNEQGKIRGFQISFPPYQVAPYAAGSPSVDIAAESLEDYLKPELSSLFD